MSLNNEIKEIDIFDIIGKPSEEEYVELDATNISLSIINQIDAICDRKNISQTELADMLDVSKSYITQLYTGSKNINMKMLSKMLRNLKCDLSLEISESVKFDGTGDEIYR